MTPVDTTPKSDQRIPGFLPILFFTSGCSLLLSLFISGYAGMGLAILTLIFAGLTLGDAKPKSRNWVCAISICGFLVGLSALVMKVIVDGLH